MISKYNSYNNITDNTDLINGLDELKQICEEEKSTIEEYEYLCRETGIKIISHNIDINYLKALHNKSLKIKQK